MSDQIWVNNRQPQTLYIAQVIMYFRGVMAILLGGALFSLGSVSLFGSTLLGAVYTLLITVGVIAGLRSASPTKSMGLQTRRRGCSRPCASGRRAVHRRARGAHLRHRGAPVRHRPDLAAASSDEQGLPEGLVPMSSSSPILDEGVNVDPDNLPSGEEKRHQVRSLFDTIAPRYDLVNRIMSFGLDARWRKASMKKLSAPEVRSSSIWLCGTGDFCRDREGRNGARRA